MTTAGIVATVKGVSLQYGKVNALSNIDLDIPAGCITGVIGPDGVGKSSLLALLSGARVIQAGDIQVLGGNLSSASHRRKVCPRIAYMPQGLGKNLYPTLTVFENIDFFGRLFGHEESERHRRIRALVQATGLAPFIHRPAGKLSGGMKQKLGLCCALIHDPDFLILDEPTTGVDPLSRRNFWELIAQIRHDRPAMSVLVATAYMEEAQQFDWLVAMDGGRVLAADTPAGLLQNSGASTLEAAFVALQQHGEVVVAAQNFVPARKGDGSNNIAIRARDLTARFGNFTAVDHVSFSIEKGEIFGFVGSNGCGKTTTMKMLTGLLPPSEGEAWLFGQVIDSRDIATRRRVGYMSQSFSLYSELTVRQNLELHARLFQVASEEIAGRVQEMARRFGLSEMMEMLPGNLPLGHRQRLSLAVAMIHKPEMLILDEPTSGVDPAARDAFWRILIELSRQDGVTIFVSTHFMNEAERCDRVSLMHAGRVLATDTPAALVNSCEAENLEDAFVQYLQRAISEQGIADDVSRSALSRSDYPAEHAAEKTSAYFSFRRTLSYGRRETLELLRDPIRLTLALVGCVILMFVMGYGINMDVENLSFAVLDRDQTTLSHNYTLNLSGSNYFIERNPLQSYDELDRRMRSGELSLAIEIPPDFARDVARGRTVQIGAWVDGAMPARAETVLAYVQGMHQHWLVMQAQQAGMSALTVAPVNIEVRYRYNPDVKSLVAMVPAVIPMLLMMIPAMLATLSVVREKELGSIINFYVTPTTSLEFVMGKQVPYILLSLLSFLLLTLFAVTIFGVPLKGSFVALTAGAILYVSASTGLGMLISIFMRSQTAAVFGTAVLTMLPVQKFSGLIDPVSTLEGVGRVIGEIYPTTHFLIIARGTFSKALGFSDLIDSFIPLLLAVPILIALCALLLRKQEA